MTHILIPREPSTALLRPFIGCNNQELHEAWAAMVRIAEVQHDRADSQCLAQIEEPPQPVAPVLDDRWKARMLDGRAPERDEMGFGNHPELPSLDEGMMPRSFFAALGLELAHTRAEDQLDGDALEAMSEAVNWTGWTPTPPPGDGWKLVSIFDTEDGPAAWWLRELPEAEDGTTTIRNLQAEVKKLAARIARISRAGAAPAAVAPAGGDIDWDVLTEDPSERAMFDRNLGLLYGGDPRVPIATSLRIWAQTNGNGSFGAQCAVYANEVAKMHLAAPALEAPAGPESAPWCPDVCPITGRPFFMWIDHWQTGKPVPTYGGPYDSYTIPAKDSDGSFECERYDHDEGGWLTEGAGWHCLGVKLVNDQSFVVDPSNPRYNEIEAFAAAAPQASAAPVVVPAQGDPAALLQLAELLESGRSLIHTERKEAADALRHQAAAAKAAPVAPVGLPWRTGIPPWTDDRSVRVIAVTAHDDFGDVQVHDIRASDFHTDGDGDGAEVARVCTHWAYRDDIWPRADAVAPAAPIPWDNFPAYLIDHCEGQTITEEGLQRALSAMLANPQYAAAAPAAPAVDSDPQGLRDVGEALMETIERNADALKAVGWLGPMDCPSEIVVDLLNLLDEANATSALGEWVATLEVDSEGGLDYEIVPPCTLPAGCYPLYRAAQAAAKGT
ncbi:hypothetical protein [Delftia sp. RIT313]|uniref:hypothetical protein n=1 Tax=Delftia sp. RIT313 TaxID=1468410 RepID=UPI0004500786|nr:hypothetical protein [Delftia sp. RIT313]EZP56355.1 hypothetical protein BW39_01668 [Delftia sp. RIT313]